MKIKLTKYTKKNNDNLHWKCVEAGNNIQQYNQNNGSRPGLAGYAIWKLDTKVVA